MGSPPFQNLKNQLQVSCSYIWIHDEIIFQCDSEEITEGACSNPQLLPSIFFKYVKILLQEVESYLEGFMCESGMRNLSMCSLGKISKNPPKWENMVTTIYKTISNINICFSNCLQMRYTFCNFFALDDILFGK